MRSEQRKPQNIVPIRLGVSTIYLIPGSGGYLQVDTGYERDYPRYLQGLQRAGIALHEIRLLFLTHHHDDHAGFLNDLTRDTDAIVIAHQQSAELLAAGANDMSRGGGYVNGTIKRLAGLKKRFDPAWTLAFPPFQVRSQDRLVAGDDDRLLRQAGIQGKILTTPGHCVDHIALALDTGAVFCGDAAANMLRWAGTKYCTVFMTDMEAAYRSWDKMLASGAEMIYPAHGKPFAAGKLGRYRGLIRNQDLAKFF